MSLGITKKFERDVVFTTTDYKMFKSITGNRPFGLRKQLLESIARDGQVCPVIVDDQLNLIDGQHRLAACAELGLPVSYVIRDVSQDVLIEVNKNQKEWKFSDYFYRHVSLENPNYLEIKRYMDFHALGLEHVLTAMHGGLRSFSANNKARSVFLAGEFVVTEAHRTNITRAMSFISDLFDCNGGLFKTKLLQARMFTPLVRFVLSKHYDHERMVRLFEERVIFKRFVVVASVYENLVTLCDIYNHSLRANKIKPEDLLNPQTEEGAE